MAVIEIGGANDLQKIVVINPKGGCGKTTLSTNIASYYALRGTAPTVIDCDPLGYCIRWLEKRPADRPVCYGIEAFSAAPGEPLELPADSRIAIIDLPSVISFDDLHGYTHLADSVLLPVVPSAIDVFSASRFIAELMLNVQLDRHDKKLAIVANRVKSRTRSFEMLKRFLTSLKIPMIATLRDSQVFVQAAAQGIGICDLPDYLVRNDLPQMSAIMQWLERPLSGVSRDHRDDDSVQVPPSAYERDQDSPRTGVQT